MAYQLRLWAATLACLLASACATAPPAPPPLPLADLFSNARFAAPSQPVGADALFELSAPMAAYLNSKKFRSAVRKKGAEMGLVDALYDKQGLQLDYDASSTRDAAETFAARRGNCLSLVLMTAAFAKALKLDVTFQEVRLDPEWSRTGQLYIGSSHVNLNIVSSLLSTSSQPPNALTIDFIPPRQAGRQRTTVISENMIVAMFMNNRAAEELAVGRLDNAYWWARSAVMHEPRFVPAYNTLGVVYQKRGYDELAERVYTRRLASIHPN